MQIHHWHSLSHAEQHKLLMRPEINMQDASHHVAAIIKQVKVEGDMALFALTARYDHVSLIQLEVTAEEWKEAKNNIAPAELEAIQFAAAAIEKNHTHQLLSSKPIETTSGVYCERQARPIQRVGLYVPGGSAPLVSSVLMQAIPARIAGCPVCILATPPNQEGKVDPRILVAAQLCGIKRVFKMGGAQAIAAMAYGTETVPKVDKIFGPGNTWVMQAKLLVSQDPDGATIDMPAGPSEVMVIADEEANPEFVAADLLSQAEHGPDSQVLLLALSVAFAESVKEALEIQLPELTRHAIAKKSLQHSHCLVVENISEAIEISNEYAPEHLILQIEKADHYVPHIQNAGAVFVGAWAPETVGDYVTGSNHVLPTSGYARTWSGLSVADFMKFISVQYVTEQGLKNIGAYAETLAVMEGLDAHRNAVVVRKNKY